ncbi:MAG: endonuclease/exonuclease/phosphatase family protein [Gemmataceae bacterium]|nr:endonuclease/exonuclease/phosphatase family protein [Gemmataceae bacterium]MCI0739027.1 endonuclease/exonuclease/phosphatase family protein [Gemmataceae bacterium]
MRVRTIVALLVACVAVPVQSAEPSNLVNAQPDDARIRVMSYNIRFGTADDGVNHWDRRKDFLAATIKAFDPDLLGTQETLGFQRDYLAKQLPGHDVFGVGRDDGKEKGEMMALYWRKDRFDKLDGGHFWLSETPDQPGSKSWDSSLPRMVTWVKLRDRRQPKATPILFLNTHFDHRGVQARLESARLIRKKFDELGKDCSMLITGDFNAAEGSAPYQALFGDKSAVIDSFRAVHPKRLENEGTSSGFSEKNTKGPRIDWIACTRDWQIEAAAIDRTASDGRTPSDHFPITALIRR